VISLIGGQQDPQTVTAAHSRRDRRSRRRASHLRVRLPQEGAL